MKELKIRIASAKDAAALLEIYAPYVKNTAITFEYEVPSLQEFERRFENILKKYPYLVAETDGKIVGYAYVSAFKERAAYDWAVETSIYIDKKLKRMGIGKKLYSVLEEILKKQNILNLNSCIAFADIEDEFLKNDSVYFHEKCGYSMVGKFHKCGCKFGKWYSMVWMEKFLGEHNENPKPMKWFSQLQKESEDFSNFTYNFES